MSILHILIWVALVGAFVFFYFGGKKNKKKYAGRDMSVTGGWYEKSQSLYGGGDTKKAYFFEYDKNYMTQGHLMVDRDHKPVYEAKILYGDPVKGYEMDITNHIIGYTHHHKIGAAVETGIGSDNAGIAVSSYFKFDGENIWQYLKNLGYDYHLNTRGLAYWIDVTRDGAPVGTIYSSNNGKNFFGCEGPIQPKAGGKGLNVVECADRDLDAMFLMTMAFARTELSLQNLK